MIITQSLITISPFLYIKDVPASSLYTPLKNVSLVGTKLNSKYDSNINDLSEKLQNDRINLQQIYDNAIQKRDEKFNAQINNANKLFIPKGSVQGGRVKAGTRSIHAFGGQRVKE